MTQATDVANLLQHSGQPQLDYREFAAPVSADEAGASWHLLRAIEAPGTPPGAPAPTPAAAARPPGGDPLAELAAALRDPPPAPPAAAPAGLAIDPQVTQALALEWHVDPALAARLVASILARLGIAPPDAAAGAPPGAPGTPPAAQGPEPRIRLAMRPPAAAAAHELGAVFRRLRDSAPPSVARAGPLGAIFDRMR